MQNADGVTLESMEIIGSGVGVFAADGSDSDDLTIRNMRFVQNGTGVSVDNSNDRTRITESEFDGGATFMQRHVIANGVDSLIDQSFFTRGGTGGNSGSGTIMIGGLRSVIRDNEVVNDRAVSGAIFVSNGFTTEADRGVARNNIVRDSLSSGIFGNSGALIEGNTLYNLKASAINPVLAIQSSGVVRSNVIFDSEWALNGTGLFENNRVYGNTRGISASPGGRFIGNQVYDNLVAAGTSGTPYFANNEFYRNDVGFVLGTPGGGAGAILENNTILQSTGNMFDFATSFSSVVLTNNILRTESGAIIHAPFGANIVSSDFNHFEILGAGVLANLAGQSFTDPNAWFYATGYDKNSSAGDPLFIDLDGPNNLLGYDRVNKIDYGFDDSFTVSALSSTVDRGNPTSIYMNEPMPNGDRINIGSTGNTIEAASRPGQQLYVLNPNGLEKLAVGSNIDLRWTSSGLTTHRPVTMFNLGGTSVDNFLADSVRIQGSPFSIFENTNTTTVATPAPLNVYKSGVWTGPTVGSRSIFQIPVPNGDYTLRLHFSVASAANASMNILVNGQQLATNFDVATAAGGALRAALLPLNVSAVGGQGLRLEIVANTTNGATIAGLEVVAANANGVADPRVDLQWSNNGTTWNNIATNQPMDRFGRGQSTWAIPSNLPLGNNYRVRAISSSGTAAAEDQSDKPFELVNSGVSYYVNDGSSSNDVYTTAVGNDVNAGKSPSQPMASLEAVFRTYDLNPGDTIYVDSGVYNLTRDLTITNGDSGVRILGPADRSAVIDRGNSQSNERAFILDNADGITFENLLIRDAGIGIFANFAQGANAGSDNLTVRNVVFTGNSFAGVSIDGGNHFATVVDSVFDGGASRNQSIHLMLQGSDSVVSGNLFTKSSGGSSGSSAVFVTGSRGLVEDNEFIDNRGTNLTVFGGAATVVDRSIVRNNVVRDSLAHGISASGFVLVDSNLVHSNGEFGNLSQPLTGISGNGVFQNNVVYGNQLGMSVNGGTAIGNTVYGNDLAGIWTNFSSIIAENRIYSNPIGVRVTGTGGGSTSDPRLENNLLYANGVGVRLTDNSSALLTSNTIYQVTGDAIDAQNQVTNLRLQSNILSVDAGRAISLSGGFTTLSGDYNLYHVRGAAGAIANLQGTIFTDLTTWRYGMNVDANGLVGDPRFVDFDGADNTLGFTTANFGADDNFRLMSDSPGVDRGNPNAAYLREPAPNGNRIDIGAYGNTSFATLSSVETVQVLSPNGFEKLEVGTPIDIQFQSSGLSSIRPVAQFASGLTATGRWASGASYQLTGDRFSTTATIDTSAVTNPAPSSVYQTNARIDGVGASLVYALPIANGNYNIRLHFAEHNTFIPVGGRRFDIQMQGGTVDGNVDVRAIAGAANKAIVRSFSGISVTNGLLDLKLVNLTPNGAILSAIEITADDPVVDPTPTVNCPILK